MGTHFKRSYETIKEALEGIIWLTRVDFKKPGETLEATDVRADLIFNIGTLSEMLGVEMENNKPGTVAFEIEGMYEPIARAENYEVDRDVHKFVSLRIREKARGIADILGFELDV